MTYGTAKNIVRDAIGDRNLNNSLMTFFVEQGLREIETRGNFYWMVSTKFFLIDTSRSAYSLTGSSDLALTNFKEARYLLQKAQGTTRWTPVKIKGLEETVSLYTTNATGEPKTAAVDNETLYIFPPKADQAYDMQLGFFQWTSMPSAGNTATNEVLTRWPQAIIWAAAMHGILHKTHDSLAAKPYAELLQSELEKVQTYSDERLRIPDINRMKNAAPRQAIAAQ